VTLGAGFCDLWSRVLHGDDKQPAPDAPEKNITDPRENIEMIRKNSYGDAYALEMAIVISAGLVSLMLWGFFMLRRRHPLLFDGRRRRDAPQDPRRVSFKISYVEFEARIFDPEADRVIQTAGLDGWMQLRFYTLNCSILATMGWFCMIVLCPLHVFFGIEEVDPLSKLGINSLSRGHHLFWVHALLVWWVVGVTGFLLLRAQTRFLMYRYGWLGALPRPRATTLIVENIPREYRSDKKLHAFFESIFPGEAVERAYVVRKVPELSRKMKELKSAKYMLKLAQERVESANLSAAPALQSNRLALLRSTFKNCCRRFGSLAQVFFHVQSLDVASPDEDEIEQYKKEVQEAKQSFEKEREEVYQKIAEEKTEVFSRTGFVTFSSRRCAALALDRRYRPAATEMSVDIPPDPVDVLWKDLAVGRKGTTSRESLGILCLFLVFIFWAPLIVLVSGLATLKSFLRQVTDGFEKHLTGESWSEPLMEGWISQLLLKTIMAIMPNILLFIIRKFFILKAGTWAQLRLQEWYYYFQVIFVVLAAAFGRSLYLALDRVLNDFPKAFSSLENELPRASNFYLSYAVLGWSGTAVYLLRPIALAKYAAFRTVVGKIEAVYRAQDEHPAFFGTGVRMTKATTMTTVTLVFCMCSPMICFFALVYFCINRAVYAYLLMRAEEKRPDLGGAYWVKALEQVFFGLLLFVVVMVGILSYRGENKGPAIAAGLSLVLLHWFWKRFRGLEWRSLPMEKVIVLDSREAKETGSEYIQPEFTYNPEDDDREYSKMDRAGNDLGMVETDRSPVPANSRILGKANSNLTGRDRNSCSRYLEKQTSEIHFGRESKSKEGMLSELEGENGCSVAQIELQPSKCRAPPDSAETCTSNLGRSSPLLTSEHKKNHDSL